MPKQTRVIIQLHPDKVKALKAMAAKMSEEKGYRVSLSALINELTMIGLARSPRKS